MRPFRESSSIHEVEGNLYQPGADAYIVPIGQNGLGDSRPVHEHLMALAGDAPFRHIEEMARRARGRKLESSAAYLSPPGALSGSGVAGIIWVVTTPVTSEGIEASAFGGVRFASIAGFQSLVIPRMGSEELRTDLAHSATRAGIEEALKITGNRVQKVYLCLKLNRQASTETQPCLLVGGR